MPNHPERLTHGDLIGLIAPASAPLQANLIDRSIQALERLGFKVELGAHTRKRLGFLAGTDRERAGDLMRMFMSRKVKGIFCVRGGYGTARLLPLLDYRMIRENPKVFVGYSDITSLHCAFLTKANLVSFHGPMAASDLLRQDLPKFTVDSLLRTVTQLSAPGSIVRGYQGEPISRIRRGKVSGPLLGGNLSLLCTTIGTSFQPSFKGRILFFEDLDEAPYRFDRMLTYLLNCGLLQTVAGVAVGINKNCSDPRATKKEFRQTLHDVLRERLSPLKVPVVVGLPFGHVPWNATLPIGTRATLDAVKGDLVVTEPAVR